MTDRTHRTIPRVEELEPRTLPAGFNFFGFSPAVQADAMKIQTDTLKLQNDLAALAPTLQKDQQAIDAAIANSPTVQAAKAKLTQDLMPIFNLLAADRQAFVAATDSASRTAAINKFFADLNAGIQVYQADQAAVEMATANDATIQQAKAKYQADLAPITADQTVLQADYAQFFKDLQGG